MACDVLRDCKHIFREIVEGEQVVFGVRDSDIALCFCFWTPAKGCRHRTISPELTKQLISIIA